MRYINLLFTYLPSFDQTVQAPEPGTAGVVVVCVIAASGTNPNLFEWGEILSLAERGTKLWAEARGRELGMGFLGMGNDPHPLTRGSVRAL